MKYEKYRMTSLKIAGGLAGLILFFPVIQSARAIFVSSPQDPILTGDITTTEILNGTIVSEDLSASSGFTLASSTIYSLTVGTTTATSTFRFAAGSVTAPSIAFTSSPSTGLFFQTEKILIAAGQSSASGAITSSAFSLPSGSSFRWGSTPDANGSVDTYVGRASAGVLKITTDGTTAGGLTVGDLTATGAVSLAGIVSSAVGTTSGQALNINDWVVAATTTNAAVNTSVAGDTNKNQWGDNSNLRFAAVYRNSSGMLVTSVSFSMAKVASPTDNLQVTVFGTISDLPSTPLAIASSSVVAGSSLTTSLAYYKFGFWPAVYIPPNMQFAFVVSRSGAQDAVNYYEYELDTTPTDANLFQAFENGGVNSWAGNANDIGIRIEDSGQTAGRVYLASAIATSTAFSYLGVVTENVATSAAVNIAVVGFQSGFTGLKESTDLFLPSCYRCNPTEYDYSVAGAVGRSVNANAIKLTP